MKNSLAAAARRVPFLVDLARRLRDRSLFGGARKRIKGKGNRFSWGDAILSDVRVDIVGNDNEVRISAGCTLRGVLFHIRGDRHRILVGENCRFNHGGKLWFEDSGCVLTIGAGSSFEEVSLALTESGSKVDIGSDCMFAYGVDVRTGDSHAIVEADTGKRINPAESVRIGNHVWVGAHAIILKGVDLADGCVVASGSVVTKRFEQPGVIVAGNPARVVREGVSWLRERI